MIQKNRLTSRNKSPQRAIRHSCYSFLTVPGDRILLRRAGHRINPHGDRNETQIENETSCFKTVIHEDRFTRPQVKYQIRASPEGRLALLDGLLHANAGVQDGRRGDNIQSLRRLPGPTSQNQMWSVRRLSPCLLSGVGDPLLPRIKNARGKCLRHINLQNPTGRWNANQG